MSNQRAKLSSTPSRQTSTTPLIRSDTLVQPMPLDWLTPDEKLDHPLYVKVSDRYVMFRNTGDTLSEKRLSVLGDNSLYITRKDWQIVLDKIDKMAKVTGKPGNPEETAKFRNILLAYEMDLEINKNLDGRALEKVNDVGCFLAESFKENPELAVNLLKRYKEYDIYYANHSVNVAVFCAIIGIQSGFKKKQLQELILAGLTHNTGNLFIEPEVLNKPGPLTEEEWNTVQNHPALGAEHLKTLGAPSSVVLTALQHHERMDGAGYPNKISSDDIHQFARIVSIADVYDALLSVRPHARDPFVPRLAITMMTEMEGKFDLSLFKAAIKLNEE